VRRGHPLSALPTSASGGKRHVRGEHLRVATCADDHFEVVDLRLLASVALDRANQQPMQRLGVIGVGLRAKRCDRDAKPAYFKFERLNSRLVGEV
jgi:hypothetical protein